MVEQTRLAGSRGTLGHSGHLCHICNKRQACFPIPDEVGPIVLEATGVAPAEWVHGTTWKKSEKFARAAKANARLMIHRAPIRQPVVSEYGGG